ncbi:hypothetical protein MTO96_001601 [Rhipicephalus appendiculatus]
MFQRFRGNTPGNGSLIFSTNFTITGTVSGVSELDVRERVLPVALRGAHTAQWLLRLRPTFLPCDSFIAAFREEFLPVDYVYRTQRGSQPHSAL